MNAQLSDENIRRLKVVLSMGAEDASRSFSKWLRGGVHLRIDNVELCPIEEATTLLGDEDSVVSACVMGLTGRIGGFLILACDNQSGLALADLLMGQPVGTSTEWGELEKSAALETANILGCSYINSLAGHFPYVPNQSNEMIPSPPEFIQDYAASILQGLLIEQAEHSDHILLIQTVFEKGEDEMNWRLLLAPDVESMQGISEAFS